MRGVIHNPTRRFWRTGFLITLLAWSSVQTPNARGETYQLKHVEARDLAERLRPLLNSHDDIAKIEVDTDANCLTVQGSPTIQRQAGELIGLLDQPASEPGQAPPRGETNEVVRGYRIPTEDLGRVAAELQGRYPPPSGVKLFSDGRTGQMIVVAPMWAHESIAKLLGKKVPHEVGLSGQPSAATANRRTDESARLLRLRHISCHELEAALTQLFQERLQLTESADGQTAQLLITEQNQKLLLDLNHSKNIVQFNGPPRLVRVWGQIVRGLDSVDANPGYRTRLVRVQPANRKYVQRAVGLLSNDSVIGTRVTPAADRLSQREQPSPPGRQAERLLAANNPGDIPAGAEAKPREADVREPADETDGEAAGRQPRERGQLEAVQIETIEGSDVVIIKGRHQDVQRVVELIKQIEQVSAVTEPELQILDLKHVDSTSMAELVRQLYGDVFAPRQGMVSVTPLVKPNAVLIIGREQNVKVVVELVKRLDQPVAPESQFHVFQLRHVSASAAEQTIRNFFDDAAALREEGGRGGLGTKVRVTSEIRSNALIIQASPRDLVEVQRLIKMIDVETSSVKNRVEIFQLRNSRAEDLAPILQQAISGQPNNASGGQSTDRLPGQLGGGSPVPAQGADPSAANQARSSMLTFTVIGPEGRQMLESGIMSDVRIHADPSTNSLIITGPEQATGLIAALVERLDQLPSAEAQIKVFTLENGDAGGMRDMLEDLFAQRDQESGIPSQTATGVADSSLIALRFSVDRRTNSIIATGAAPDLIVVDAIIRRLDGVDLRQRRNLVYRLRYTPAPFVAVAIQDFLRAEQLRTQQELLALTRGTESTLNPFEQIEREVVVVAPAVVLTTLPKVEPVKVVKFVTTSSNPVTDRPPGTTYSKASVTSPPHIPIIGFGCHVALTLPPTVLMPWLTAPTALGLLISLDRSAGSSYRVVAREDC